MVVTPAATPVIIPVLLPTIAMVPVVGPHNPPVVPSVTVAIAPAHTADAPPITAGFEFTVIRVVTTQPDPIEYVIVVVPAVIPVTIPLSDPTCAIPGPADVHVPPPVASLSVVVAIMHTCVVPVIAGGSAFTVTFAVDLQPVVSV